jgi:hypothetical protein
MFIVADTMDRKDIDQAAFNGKEIDSPIIADEIYWLGMYYIYKVCKTDNIPTEQAKLIKQTFVKKVDDIARYEQIFLDSLRVMTELDKLIAPESKLKELTKQEALEKLLRFQAVLNGTLEKYDGDMPQIYSRLMNDIKKDNDDNDGDQGQIQEKIK